MIFGLVQNPLFYNGLINHIFIDDTHFPVHYIFYKLLILYYTFY